MKCVNKMEKQKTDNKTLVGYLAKPSLSTYFMYILHMMYER